MIFTYFNCVFLQQTVLQWQKVFFIATAILICTGGLYLAFAQSELQPWNSPDIQKTQNGSELVSMKNEEEKEEEKKEQSITIKQ